MKRFSCSDSLGALVCPSQEKKNRKNSLDCSGELEVMLHGLGDEDFIEESSQITEKKSRLSSNQVKALEKIFEVDNRLEPEKKERLAEELGLKPRQVAIWFQNRRARRKTKQLERDFSILKANYEGLKLNFNRIEQEREALIAEIKELRVKLGEQNRECSRCAKAEVQYLVPENIASEQRKVFTEIYRKHEVCSNGNIIEIKGSVDFKEGLSDSDSSAVLNEDGNLNAQQLVSPFPPSLTYEYDSFSFCSPWINNCLQFSESRATTARGYEEQFVKMEEQSLFSTEESCNIFSVDQAPTLHW